MNKQIKYTIFGDTGILIKFDEKLSEVNSRMAVNFSQLIRKENIEGFIEAQVSYNSIVVHYDPLKIGSSVLIMKMRKTEAKINEIELPRPRVYDIPTLYGGEYGPDLEYVAEYHGITPEEVIGIHTKEPLWLYRFIQNIVPAKLITPRREVPRLKVPAGSVGIGDKQTGVYPIDSSAGWNIIGRTPLKLYDPQRDPPFLFEIGNYVHYRST